MGLMLLLKALDCMLVQRTRSRVGDFDLTES